MSGQITTNEIVSYRIGDPHGTYPIFDFVGSTINPGRWNTAFYPVIYTSMYYSTALLEKLVYSSGILPSNQHYIDIKIPTGSSYEVFDVNGLANRGWDDPGPSVSKAFGDAWLLSGRSLLLIVPSVIARLDENVLINPKHPQFPSIRPATFNRPVHWDRRLFGSASASP